MKAYFYSLTLVGFILPLLLFDFNISSSMPCSPHGGKDIKENQSEETNYRIKKVVIDPGHGGKDSGCAGQTHLEKDLALNISLKLGRALKNSFPNLEVIYTRNTDVFVPLHQRAAIANRHQADLFISIHCNAIKAADHVSGTETYVMGLHTAEANLAVAKRENASILLEDNYTRIYQGYDPHSAEGHIILSMYQNAYLEQSIRFAEKVEQNLNRITKRKSRGVKQAGFLVLRETTMPSVLIETGYLTNSSDHFFLAQENGQNAVAHSILKAFKAYKQEVENGQTDVVLANNYPTYRQATQPYTRKSVPNTRPQAPQLSSPARPTPSPQRPSTIPVHYKILLAATEQMVDTRKAPWNSMDYSVQVNQEGGLYKYYVIGFRSYEAAADAKKDLRKLGFTEAFVVGYQGGKRVFPKE
ncbi:MAG: N-acetylmuramoyl-L-alanine amidase [Bacteroidota bacterium]